MFRASKVGVSKVLAVALLGPAIWLSSASSAMAGTTVVTAAMESNNLSTLVKAVQAAGLAETLGGEGPFTVFAPSDDAFAKVPPAKLEALLANREALIEILSYHVVPGKLMAQDVASMRRARTAQGQSVDIKSDGVVMVDSATVVQADIVTSNGVVHVIDEVMLPLGISIGQDYDLMDPDVYLVAPDRLPPNIYNAIYGR